MALVAGVYLLVGVRSVDGVRPADSDHDASATRRPAAASITAGLGHTCVLVSAGAVRCWGMGASGQLGHDSTTNVGDGAGSDPSVQTAGDVPVGGVATAVTAGRYHTCALLTSGAVRCWGYGGDGELGHNTTSNLGDGFGSDPSIKGAGDVPLGGPAVALTAGGDHTCALMATGGIRCWGRNSEGQLGYDNTTSVGDGVGSDPSIQHVGDVRLGGTAVAITAGAEHTCALLTTGAVRCWGHGADGELGHNTTTNVGDGVGTDPSIKAAGDVPLGGAAIAITAGDYHTCALLATGQVRCWGYGFHGQLGHDATTNVGDGGVDDSIKTAGDVPLGGRAVAVTAGSGHTCALLSTGAVRCWGLGLFGQLGHDTTTNVGDGGSHDSIATAGDVPLGGPAVAITAGSNHTCALLATRALRCWGSASSGQLGYGSQFSVGAGGADHSIQSAGDVPIGPRVRRFQRALTKALVPERHGSTSTMSQHTLWKLPSGSAPWE